MINFSMIIGSGSMNMGFEKCLSALGIQTRDSDNHYKNVYDILSELSVKWSSLNSKQQGFIKDIATTTYKYASIADNNKINRQFDWKEQYKDFKKNKGE